MPCLDEGLTPPNLTAQRVADVVSLGISLDSHQQNIQLMFVPHLVSWKPLLKELPLKPLCRSLRPDDAAAEAAAAATALPFWPAGISTCSRL